MKKLLGIYTDSFKGLSTESWMLSIVMLINRTGSMVLPFLGVYMTDHLNFSLESSGLVLSCFGIGSVIGSWLGGYLTDKIGEYHVQYSSLLLSVPLFCLYPLFSTPLALGMMVLLQSIVTEVFRPANSVAIAKYANPRNLTRAFSLNRMAVNLGFSLGPALGGLMATVSYNFLFYTNAAAALAAGLMYIYFFNRRQRLFRIRLFRSNRDRIPTAHPAPKERSPYKDVIFLLFCVICTAFSICFFQLMSSLPLFYKNKLGLNKMTIGLLMGANGFIVVIFEMLLVHLAEKRFTTAFFLFAGTLLCAISYFLLGFEPGLLLLFLSMAFLSLGEILVMPFMSTITAQRAGGRNKGAYMGVNGMAFAVAFIIAPILGTYLAVAIGFSMLWIGTALLLFLCSVAFYYVVPLLTAPTESTDSQPKDQS